MGYTVLLATDGSPGALRAANWLREHLPEGYRVRLIAVRPTISGTWPDVDTHPEDVEDLWQGYLAATARVFQGITPPPQILLRAGDPAMEILAEISSSHPDLVVLGSRGHSPLGGALLGSVSLAIAGRSPVPVLIVPGERP